MNIQDTLIDNEYIKQIRLVDGVLINIYKCSFKPDLHWRIENPRKQLIKIEDNFYKLKEEIEDKWTHEVFEVGTVLYKSNCSYFPIGDIKTKDDWEWEVKTTGCAFSSNTEYFKELIKCILDLIENE